MARPGVAPARLVRWPTDDERPDDDLLAVEAPLEIRLDHGPVDDRRRSAFAVTMRTPGDDLDLAVGYLLAEGVVADPTDVVEVRPCSPPTEGDAVRVVLAPHVAVPDGRVTPISSACGVCGVVATEQIPRTHGNPTWTVGPVDPGVLATLPEAVRAAQVNFRLTGGIHAAARCSADGAVLDVREDVGRHNAMDKLVGRAFATRELPLADQVLVLSGRASWELVQKAVRAGVAFVAAVGAPSSAAREVAEAHGVTLVGFLRADRFNVYAHPERIDL